MIHSFVTEIATEYGIHCAIVLGHLQFWIEKNEAACRNFRDGKYWTFNSVEAIAETFSYMTVNQVRRAIEKLKAEGLIETGNFNTTAFDRKLWYALTDKGKSLFLDDSSHLANLPNGYGNRAEWIRQPRQMETATVPNGYGNSAKTTITDIDTDIKHTDIDTDGKHSRRCLHKKVYTGREVNPYGDNDDNDRPNLNTVEAYASSNLRSLTGGNMERLQSFKDELPDELIRYGIDMACGRGHPFYAYLEPILQSYVEHGFRTVAEIEAYEQRRKSKGGHSGGVNGGSGSGDEYQPAWAGETVV